MIPNYCGHLPVVQRKRLVLFTSQEIGFKLVESWAARTDIDLLVIAERTRRDDVYGYRSALQAAADYGVKCIKASKISDQVKTAVITHNPELIISAYFPHIIPIDLIELPTLGSVNIHPGLLPFYRGKFPTPWYILNGSPTFGIAIHRLDSGVDTGDVLLQAEYQLPGDITGHALYRLTMDLGASLLIENLDNLLAGTLEGKRQTGIGSYFNSIEPRWQIDWNLSLTAIERRVRVHAKPFLPAYTFAFNRIIFVNRVLPTLIDGYGAQGGGKIIALNDDDSFIVSCSDGCLKIVDYEVYPPFNGAEKTYHLRVGDKLG